ncbi:hypothetical protein [Polyangium aurulentum]|uniref:hypothetical protein n=1 Tax=Polyangium aurulentum TaxID=2567896 RepID=UPI0010AE86FA|nr:hypothetical protein [Polyangium aurulentum]UQA57055.1 hypothetical protein E8A73_038060 [Polyangium aurulentum]
MAFARPSGTVRRVSDANMNDRVIERTREHRRMRKALATLSKPHQQALWLAYGPHAWPSEVEARFAPLGHCCGVVLLSEAAKLAFDAEMKRKRAHVRPGKRTMSAAHRARFDENEAAHRKALAELEAQLGGVAARLRRTEDPTERASIEQEAVDLRARVRKKRDGGPRILPVREVPVAGGEGEANVERAERLGVGEWLRGQSAEKHVPAIIAEARELLQAARDAIAEALRAQDDKRTTPGHRTRRAPDVRAEFWPEAAAGEVLLL